MVVLVWLSAGSLCGCVLPPVLPETATSGDSVIYVVGRGWHTDIGLPVDEVTGALASLETDFPGVRFMVFGFGERNYLMARSAGPVEMLSALFPSKSAILMTALRAPPTEAFADEQVRTLRLSHDQVDRLADLIWRGLEKAAAKRLERWRRIALEASQQSRRAHLPEIAEPIPLTDAMTRSATYRYVLDENQGAAPLFQALPAVRTSQDTVAILTGPEGGWTDEEHGCIGAAGWTPVSMGPLILRAETAVVAALAVISQAWLLN